MKKKFVTICLSLGILSFSSFAVHSSSNTNNNIPYVSSYQDGVVVADAGGAVPEAKVAAAVKVATTVGKAVYNSAKEALREVTRNASLLVYGTNTTNDVELEELDQIFDR
ncbi:hypothetical protein D3C73_874650 [compost metagenome]